MHSLFDRSSLTISHTRIALVLFFVIFLFLLVFQLHPTMLDPDGFFHAKMGLLTAEQGYVKEFTQLPLTTLSEFWTDQHYIYHLASVPFVKLFDPLWGVKIFSVFLGALLGVTFFYVLKNFLNNPRSAFWWTLVLFSSAAFVLRLSQVKAQPLALILFLLIILSIYKNKYLWLALLSFIYVHAHGSFILVPLVIGWLFLFEIISSGISFSVVRKYMHLLFVSVVFITLGLLTQPTFPENLIFYFYQTIQIAALRVGDLEITGLEWGALSFIGWLRLLGPLFIPFIFLLSFTFFEKQKLTFQVRYFIWLLIPFIFLTTHSVRHLEFFLPLFVIVLAMMWQSYEKSLTSYIRDVKRFIERFPVVFISITLLPATWLLWSLLTIYNFHSLSAPSLYEYKSISNTINKRVPKDELIVNTRWDMFPMLFYYTEHNYLVGMDPGFLYLADERFYSVFNRLRDESVVKDDIVNFLLKYNYNYVISSDAIYTDVLGIRLFSDETNFKKLYDDESHALYLLKKQ